MLPNQSLKRGSQDEPLVDSRLNKGVGRFRIYHALSLGVMAFIGTVAVLHFLETSNNTSGSVFEFSAFKDEPKTLSLGSSENITNRIQTLWNIVISEDNLQNISINQSPFTSSIMKTISSQRKVIKTSNTSSIAAHVLKKGCIQSFEPICPMYDYVRFWNKEFSDEDCYRSPASHPLGLQAPVAERRYVVFEPDRGGWNNIRMAAETAMIFAHASGRILVLPPEARWYLLDSNKKDEQNGSDFEDFFDLRKISETLDIIEMERFIDEVAIPGLLNATYPGKKPDSPLYGMSAKKFVEGGKDRLWDYLKLACYTRQWEPGKFHIGFNLEPKGEENANHNEQHYNRLSLRGSAISTYKRSGTYDFNSHVKFLPFPSDRKDDRLRLHSAHKRELIPYDSEMHSHRAIYFPGNYNSRTRILTHFYTYLFWQNHHLEHVYKRLVRDRLHYHDEIFCAAGRVIKILHEEAAKLSLSSPFAEHQYEVPSARHRDPATLGGTVHEDATYIAYHIRRGDFQYKETRLSAENIYSNTKHLLNANRTRLIYIATDDKNQRFFDPLRGKKDDFPNQGITHTDKHGHVFHLRFLRDYIQKAALGHGAMNQNRIGMIEQVICANAHTFFGTPRSTFTGYITRMRGYYRDNRYARTFYTLTKEMYSLHKQTEIVGPFWAREFAVAHSAIDDDGVGG